MRLRYGTTYWLDRARGDRAARFPRHRGDVDTDVAIIGGGFTGCAAAETFAAAGVRVVLLERARIGHGSAAASTALLMQEPDRYFTELARRYDRATAKAIWRLSAKAVANLTATAAELRCGLQRPQSLHLATDDSGARDLRRDFQARRAAGLGGRLLGPASLARVSGVDGTAAILTSGNAVVDPYRATLALARKARRAGAHIFEYSTAGRVVGSRDGVTIHTPAGTVRARWVIIATGFATPAFKPLQARFKMATTYVIATQPIDAATRRRMGGGRVMFWDAERPYHYFRWTADGRLLFGGGDRRVPPTRRGRHKALVEAAASLRQTLMELYPGAGPFEISHAWEGLFATTPDGLPYIGPHRRFPRHLFALGYGGNGMTFGFLAAQLLLRHYLGRPAATDSLFGFGRF